jgi:DNA-binding response OmpR family regulator
MKILIADDDVDLTDVTEYALRREGHSVTLAHDAEQALQHFQREEPDILLLDIGIGPFDGFELARRIREHSNVPMIMVTARESEWDMARAFELGADDYVTKPYSFRQLVMRIGAVTRRARAATATTVLKAGTLRLDPETGDVSVAETSVRLTRLEFRLLQCLLANQKRVATIERLLQFAWPSDRGDVNVLKTHISHLRHKLGNTEIVIENVPGIGYRLVTPATAAAHDGADAPDAVLTS